MSILQPNPLPELRNDQPTTPMPQQKQKKGTRKLLMPMLFVLIALVFTVVGAGGYYLIDSQDKGTEDQSKEDKNTQPDTETEQEDTEEDTTIDTTDNEEVDPYKGWETLDTGKVLLKYPPTWKVTFFTDYKIPAFTHIDDSDTPFNSDKKMIFSFMTYNETGTYVCPFGTKSSPVIETKSNAYTSEKYSAIMGLSGNSESDRGNDTCESASSSNINSVHIKTREVKEFEDYYGFDFLIDPDIEFTYNTETYPEGENDFILMMASIESKN